MFAAQEIVEDLLFWTSQSRALNQSGEQKTESFSLLDTLERDLRRLHQRCLRSSEAYKIAVVGLGNVGKSTLLNALLGEKIAPVSNSPCTATVVEFTHGDGYRLLAESTQTLIPICKEFPHASGLHEQLNKMVAHGDDDPGRQYRRLEITAPSSILSGGLILTDTPGFGAAGDEGRKDDDTIMDFLTKDVAQIFWVVMADQGIGRKEHAFYEKYLHERCDDLIVTNAEDWDPHDRDRWIKRFGPTLHQSVRIHFVEGKSAKLAAHQGDMEAWEASGAAAIAERIRALKLSQARIESVHESLALMGKLIGTRRSREILCAVQSAKLAKKYANEESLSSWLNLLNQVRSSVPN
jgi:GTP-binding protein EngB required for normal cell division